MCVVGGQGLSIQPMMSCGAAGTATSSRKHGYSGVEELPMYPARLAGAGQLHMT